jgi:hypothetical protein
MKLLSTRPRQAQTNRRTIQKRRNTLQRRKPAPFPAHHIGLPAHRIIGGARAYISSSLAPTQRCPDGCCIECVQALLACPD